MTRDVLGWDGLLKGWLWGEPWVDLKLGLASLCLCWVFWHVWWCPWWKQSFYKMHPIISFQMLTPLHTLARLCWKDPDIAVSFQSMPGPSKHRSGCSQSAIGWITWPPMKELEKVPKKLKGSLAYLNVYFQFRLVWSLKQAFPMESNKFLSSKYLDYHARYDWLFFYFFYLYFL
jgi:hypothetical protein